MTKYTLTDVSKHKSKDDLWFVIHGKVYDVTKFADDHPGGGQALVDEAGMSHCPLHSLILYLYMCSIVWFTLCIYYVVI